MADLLVSALFFVGRMVQPISCVQGVVAVLVVVVSFPMKMGAKIQHTISPRQVLVFFGSLFTYDICSSNSGSGTGPCSAGLSHNSSPLMTWFISLQERNGAHASIV